MYTVYKYKLNIGGPTELDMPYGAEILHVGNQEDECFIWALVATDEPTGKRYFRCLGTGFNGDDFLNPRARHGAKNLLNPRYIGTVITCKGQFVWHFFEIDSERGIPNDQTT